MKTARLNLLISPQEKANIDARSAALKISASELVRRAVNVYDPTAETGADKELHALSGELADAVSRTGKKLDAALKKFDHFQSLMNKKETMRTEARNELIAKGMSWPFATRQSEAAKT